jgi:hypothetical protein
MQKAESRKKKSIRIHCILPSEKQGGKDAWA